MRSSIDKYTTAGRRLFITNVVGVPSGTFPPNVGICTCCNCVVPWGNLCRICGRNTWFVKVDTRAASTLYIITEDENAALLLANDLINEELVRRGFDPNLGGMREVEAPLVITGLPFIVPRDDGG